MSTRCSSRRSPSAFATGAPTTKQSPTPIATPWTAWPTSTAPSARRADRALHQKVMYLGARSARADQRRSTQQPDDLVSDLLRWRPDINGQGIFVWGRFLEGVDLALQEASGHEVAMAPRQVFGDEVAAAAKIDQPYFRPTADDDLAIGALERGTSDDARLLLAALTVDPSRDGLEPRLPIGIRQRNSRVHLGDVRLRMEYVTFLERPAETRRQFLRNRRFAGAGYPHNHQDRRTAAMGARAVEALDAGRVGDEDRIGAADEKAALDDANDAPDALFQPRRIGDRSEAAIDNAIAAIRDEGLARR